MNSFALTHCRLMTMSGYSGPRRGAELADLGWIEDGALVVTGGRITWVGPAASLRHEGETIDAKGALVTPGFVDAHTHLVFSGNRVDEYEARSQGGSYEEIARAGGGILSTVRKCKESPDLLQEAQRHAHMMLATGTTTAEAKSGYGLCCESEARLIATAQEVGRTTPLRVIPTFLGAHAVPPEFKGNPDGYVDLVCNQMIPDAAKAGVVWCDAFCESIAFTEGQVRRVAAAAKANGMKLRLHVDQLKDSGGAALAAELGAKTADHLEHTSSEGIQALAASGTQPILLPGSVYSLGHTTYPSARAMIEAGLGVVIASDFNPGSSPIPSMPLIMSLACTQMRMSPAEAWSAATWNAACSLDLQDEIGSLEVGKSADFVIWNTSEYREVPYFAGANLVASVYAGGELTSRP